MKSVHRTKACPSKAVLSPSGPGGMEAFSDAPAKPDRLNCWVKLGMFGQEKAPDCGSPGPELDVTAERSVL